MAFVATLAFEGERGDLAELLLLPSFWLFSPVIRILNGFL